MNSRYDQSSPWTLAKQIIILQVFYYATAIVLCYLLALLWGIDFLFEWVFNWKHIHINNTFGVYLIGMWLFDSFLCVVFMTIIVGRSKLAWDFALTLKFIDLVVVCIYSSSFPSSIAWWLLQIGSAIILVSLGTWTSRWAELRDTFFTGLNDAELGQSHEMRNLEAPTTATTPAAAAAAS